MKSGDLCSDAKVLRNTLRLIRTLDGERIQIVEHLLRGHAVAVVDYRELVLISPLEMIPVYVPANDAFTSVSSLLPTLDSLEGVLSQLADLLVGRGIGGAGVQKE